MPERLQTSDGVSIAFQYLQGEPPVVVFLPGFFSHMQGTKALWLEQKCRERGQAYLRFDYRGHGESGGRFENGTISDWLEDTLLVLDHVPEGPVLAVGSSMGGWIALLAALARPEIVRGVVGIATAADMTRLMYERRLDDQQREELYSRGTIRQPGPYSEEPVTITRRLIEDGERHLLLNRERLDLDIPVRLIHGKKDADIPWETSQALQRKIGEERCELILVPDGEHRLSREQDLELIDRVVRGIHIRQL